MFQTTNQIYISNYQVVVICSLNFAGGSHVASDLSFLASCFPTFSRNCKASVNALRGACWVGTFLSPVVWILLVVVQYSTIIYSYVFYIELYILYIYICIYIHTHMQCLMTKYCWSHQQLTRPVIFFLFCEPGPETNAPGGAHRTPGGDGETFIF